MEKCDNCGAAIGDLETPHVWNNHVVCQTCHIKLNAGSAAVPLPPATPIPPTPPIPTPPHGMPPIQTTLPEIRTIEKTGKIWKLHMLVAAALVLVGVVTMCAGCSMVLSGSAGQGGAAAGVLGGSFSIGFLMIMAGFVWGIVAWFMAWWHHG